MSLFIYPPQQVSIPGVATEATLQQVLNETQDINTELDTQTNELQGINSELNTQSVTLSSIDTSLNNIEATDFATEAKQDTQITELQSINTELDTQSTTLSSIDTSLNNIEAVDFATETSLSAAASDLVDLNARLAGALVPETHDYIDITYVGATTDINTVVYKTGGSGGTTVATLTMGYDGSNRLTSVTRS